jgi:hypothetical protein
VLAEVLAGLGDPLADPAAEARALLDPARAVGEAAALVDDLLRSRETQHPDEHADRGARPRNTEENP